MLKVASLPVHTEALDGCAVMLTGLSTVNVPAFDVTPAGVHAPGPFTIQRYLLLFIPAVIPFRLSVGPVAAGTTGFQVVPPSVLTSQLYVRLAPEAVTLNDTFAPAQPEASAGCEVMDMAPVVTVSTAAVELMVVDGQPPVTWQRYWLLFMLKVTFGRLRDVEIFAGTVLFQFNPPSVLTCQL